MPTRTVPIEFVRAAVATVRRQGLDVAALLRPAGISVELIEHDRARVTAEQATMVIRALWRATDDELFGLGLQPVPRGALRLVCFGLVNCPDIGTAAMRLAEYQRLLPGLPSIAMAAGPETTRFSLDTRRLDDPDHFLTDFLLAAIHRFTGWAIGGRLPLRWVELPYPTPANAADYDQVFGVPQRFGAQEAALVFDSAVLSAPIVQTEASLIAYDRNAPADLFARRDYGTSVAARARRVLERGLSGEWPDAAAVAGALSMSQQTVRRRLAEEGASLTQLREDLLRDAAIASLTRGDETVEALSARLGFSEPSAFRRAFRRWTGSPPGAYRNGDPIG